jgi:eukaryotic-like serine/threonine-protein kinase
VIAGRYSLVREIGRGGMGAVWLGRDEVLGREVALKRIGMLPGADSTDLARAEREGRLAARLNHRHVVAVYNLVIDPDTDARWLVMEYVDGTTLGQLVKQEGRLAPEDAAPLLWQAADALVAAHAAGIVHRDVKPSNILVDRSRRVKLTDFGIARIVGDPALTQTGLVTGSPAYLAPEVAAGHRGDEAVDVWSLGATTFHALSGRPPYDIGDHVLGGLYRLVNEEPPRLADAGWMAPLLDGTMVKDPSQRWSMLQVRDFLAGPPGRSAPVTAATSALPAGAVEAPPEDRGEEPTSTRQLGTTGREPTSVPEAAQQPPAAPRALSRPAKRGLVVGVAVSLLAAAVLFAVLRNHGSTGGTAQSPPPSPSDTASSPSRTPSRSPVAGPTAQGMESFVRAYVAAVALNPDAAWRMLTPKFQRESGGLDRYRSFWKGVGRGRVLEISADPRSLVVSYRVRFENFGTGRRATVLQLVFENGQYLIDGELA